MYVLFTDTENDVTPEIAKEYGYNLISMPYSIDGNDVYPYVDFEKFAAYETESGFSDLEFAYVMSL